MHYVTNTPDQHISEQAKTQPAAPPQLSPHYYVENFCLLIDAVFTRYEDLLNEDEIRLHHDFHTLSLDAKSLYVRLLTRSGQCIRKSKLNYSEISNLNNAIEELQRSHLIELNKPQDATVLLNLLTKAELQNDLQQTTQKAPLHYRKPELIEHIVSQVDRDTIHERLWQLDTFVYPEKQAAFETYLLCFFGNTHQNLSEFVISDLGHVRYEAYNLCNKTRFYNHRNAIDLHKLYSQVRESLELPENKTNSRYLFNTALNLPSPEQLGGLTRRYEKIMVSTARQLERLEALPAAMELYGRASVHPSRERQARILKKLNQPQKAFTLCQNILATSQHPEELEFALRFGKPLAKQLKQPFQNDKPTDITTETITLEKQDMSVEWAVAEHLSNHNQQCFYVENSLFCGLFGLYFWDAIFNPIEGAFLNPFQRGPLDLHSEYFYLDRKPTLDRLLEDIGTDQWQQRILHTYEHKQGIANYFVHWGIINQPLLELSLSQIPSAHIKGVFEIMLKHPGLYRNGFPDLIVFGPNHYQLIEVKAPGDVIQPNQKRWFRHFKQLGIPAILMKVAYTNNL